MAELKLSEDIAKKTMHEYRVVIQSLLDTSSEDVVQNESLSHAAIILAEMARHAKNSFFAIAQSLNPEAWGGEVVQALADARRRNVDIELLVTETDENKLVHLRAWNDDVRACIKKVSAKILNLGFDLPNFAVMDGKALRFEVDKKCASATFCANVPQDALVAQGWFQTLKQGAVPLNFA